MRLSKKEADFFARQFRADLNKAAKEGVAHQSYFYGEKFKVHYAVEVRALQDSCFDLCWGEDKKERSYSK